MVCTHQITQAPDPTPRGTKCWNCSQQEGCMLQECPPTPTGDNSGTPLSGNATCPLQYNLLLAVTRLPNPHQICAKPQEMKPTLHGSTTDPGWMELAQSTNDPQELLPAFPMPIHNKFQMFDQEPDGEDGLLGRGPI